MNSPCPTSFAAVNTAAVNAQANQGGFWEKFKNLLKYGHYVTNSDLPKALQQEAAYARQFLLSRRFVLNGKLVDSKYLDGLSNQQIVDLEDEVIGLLSTGHAQEYPPLQLLHGPGTLKESSLDYWRGKSTQEIVDSLKPGQMEPLITRDDGTVLQGNHRIQILMERGYDVNALPREILPRVEE